MKYSTENSTKPNTDGTALSERLRYGMTAGIIGIVINAVLFVLKLFAGILSGSVTVIADAVNNLSDFGSSAVTLFGFKLSAKPADREHPFGHARYEYISALIVAFVVMAIGVTLAKTSVEKILTPEVIRPGVLTYVILGVSVLLKVLQMCVYLKFGKKINSSALTACAADSRNDIISTSVVIAATVVMQVFSLNIDGWAGLAVSVFILFSGGSLVKSTIDPLLGTVPDKELVDSIKSRLLSYKGILGVHDLMIHNYGASYVFAVVHAEVSADNDFMVCHDLIDEIEREFYEQMNVHMCIHMDPVKIDDPFVNSMRVRVAKAIKELCPSASIHDFRVVEGVTHTNVLFDAVLPYDSKVSEAEIKNAAAEAVDDGKTDFRFIVNIDRAYVQ